MFEELASGRPPRALDLSPTSWSAVGRPQEAFAHKPARPAESAKPAAIPAGAGQSEPAARRAPTLPKKESAGLFGEAGKLLQSVRGFVSKNEELIVIAVILLILLDCDDDFELLIALIILLYPYIAKKFF